MRIIVLFLTTILLFFVSSCSSVNKTTMSSDDFAEKSFSFLSEYKEACKSDDGKLWGKSLCVPMVILNRETMEAITTKIDPNGKFIKTAGFWVGKYEGPQVYANTSFNWNKETWSMVLWPLPDNKDARKELLMH
ncbi:MAG: hypothetical protein HRT44_12255, partial [Bdellovibrionales bacterium]|nr:hypothetical protein [Bdellovibrionales bacterium]NQZ20011.1 hypothetical protein [Bdellovibrionales bacterium]